MEKLASIRCPSVNRARPIIARCPLSWPRLILSNSSLSCSSVDLLYSVYRRDEILSNIFLYNAKKSWLNAVTYLRCLQNFKMSSTPLSSLVLGSLNAASSGAWQVVWLVMKSFAHFMFWSNVIRSWMFCSIWNPFFQKVVLFSFLCGVWRLGWPYDA